jgi:pSer/pThr/pTyr-binding forkhead associated (FHA) protein
VFALEIDFRDGISPPETILVRRSNAIVGSSELAHVVVEGAASSLCELRLVRGLGREFTCMPVRRPGQSAATPPFLEGTYRGEAELKLGSLALHVTALDIDLNLVPEEFPDRAAIRILRRAAATHSPLFPAIAVLGAKPMYVSFPSEQPLLIGRSRKCGLRLDASDVSGEHARVGLDEQSCWVEDLGSTNGTFVGDQRIAGRRYLEPGELVSIGAEFSLMPVLRADDVARLNSESTKYPDTSTVSAYPCVVTKSDTIRPARFSLKPHQRITVGRDPANDIWANYPHVSRNHVELLWGGEELVRVVDRSSNGTYIAGEKLPRGHALELPVGLTVLDLCSGVEIAICYSESDEQKYFNSDVAEDFGGLGEISVEQQIPPVIHQPQTAEDIRAILERAAGMADEVSDENAKERSDNVFKKLVNRQSNFAQDGEEVASEKIEHSAQFVLDARTYGVSEQRRGVGVSGEELSEFDKFQLAKRQREDSASEFDEDYNLLAQAEFDEDTLEASQFGGTGRLIVMGLAVVLVLVILLLCISFYWNPYFT